MANPLPAPVNRIEMLKSAYAALNRGDVAGFMASFDPQVERIEPAADPRSATYRGLDVVRAHFVKARESWAEGSCEPERFIVADDRVVVLVHVRVRLKHEAEWRDAHVGDAFTFRDAKVVRFRTYVDAREALEWAGIDATALDQPE